MNEYSIKKTPDEILDILKAVLKSSTEYKHEQELASKLTKDLTIKDWRETFDLLPIDELSNHLNIIFDLKIDLNEWLKALHPENEKTLGDICNLISRNAEFKTK